MSLLSVVKSAKQSLRKAIASKLCKLSKEEVSKQSLSVFHKLKDLPKFKAARSVALYMSMPNIEIDTMLLIEHCFQQNKTVFLPSCCDSTGKPTSTMRFLKVNSFEEVLRLQPRGKFKLREPISGEDALESDGLDLIVVPGVAFTKEGHRLGHGAGYYDKFLTKYNIKFDSKPYLLGVGLEEQLVDALPLETHDWTLDHVVFGSTACQT